MLLNGNFFENSIHTSIRKIIFHICIRISLIILFYMNTIDDMQNEGDFFYHYNDFVYNHDFFDLSSSFKN